MQRCALFVTIVLAGVSAAAAQAPGDDVGFILRPTEVQSGDTLEIFGGEAGEGQQAPPPTSPPLAGPTGNEVIGPPLAGPTGTEPIGPPLTGPPVLSEPETAPRRRPPALEPFATTGIHLGTFVIRPAIEVGVTASDNPAGSADGKAALGLVIAPEIEARSEDTDHEIEAELRAETVRYGDEELDEREAEARIRGRYDLTSRTSIEGQARYSYDLESFTDPDTPAAASERPAVHNFDAEIGATHRFSRLSVGLAAAVDRDIHEDVGGAGGEVISREALDNTEYSARTRIGYEASAALTPFAEAEVGRRSYDLREDEDGVERSGVWGELRGGLAFDLGSKLSGEAALGLRHESFDDDELPDLDAVTAAASVLWSPRRLTEVRLDLATDVQPTSILGASGSIVYSTTLTVTRLASPRIRLEAGAGFDHEKFIGVDRREDTFSAFAGVNYAFNRTASIEGRYVHERTDSTDPASDAIANTVTVRVRLQR